MGKDAAQHAASHDSLDAVLKECARLRVDLATAHADLSASHTQLDDLRRELTVCQARDLDLRARLDRHVREFGPPIPG